MPRPHLALLLVVILTLTGCATAPSSAPPTTAEPRPDAHDLSENPLDVINLPQP